MADSKKPRASEPAPEPEEREQPADALPDVSTALASVGASLPVGGFSADFQPAGLATGALALSADVTPGLTKIAPTFGDVLLAVGQGVASSQEALDRSLIDTAKELSQTKIKVVTDVIQKINDDGLPDAANTELVTEEVSLINFLSPEVHEWKSVAVSMDFEVGALDSERGVQFRQNQGSINMGGGSLWGFIGWFDMDAHSQTTSVTQQSRTEANWATGQVRMDALLAPRRTEKFTAPSQVTIGPQIFFAQGQIEHKLDNGKEIERSIPIVVSVRKADGSPNPSRPLGVECDQFGFSFVSTAPFTGSTTNADGEIRVIVTRQIPNERFSSPVKARLTVRLGAITRTTDFVL
ncbi:MAG TPA: hypothetical protein VF092_10540 [Longimicrobium sp.]